MKIRESATQNLNNNLSAKALKKYFSKKILVRSTIIILAKLWFPLRQEWQNKMHNAQLRLMLVGELFGVMMTHGEDGHYDGLVIDSVDYAVLVVDTSRPLPWEGKSKGFGFANASVRMLSNVNDESVDFPD